MTGLTLQIIGYVLFVTAVVSQNLRDGRKQQICLVLIFLLEKFNFTEIDTWIQCFAHFCIFGPNSI